MSGDRDQATQTRRANSYRYGSSHQRARHSPVRDIVAQVMQAHVSQPGRLAQAEPEAVDLGHGRAFVFCGEDPAAAARQLLEHGPGRRGQPHGTRSGLAVPQVEVALAVVAPSESQDLPLAATGQQQQPDDRDLPGGNGAAGATPRPGGASPPATGSALGSAGCPHRDCCPRAGTRTPRPGT